MTCKKKITPTWKHINKLRQALGEKTIESVKQLWIHVGSNDTDNNDPERVKEEIEENLRDLKKNFPQADIFISKIIPRKSPIYGECIEEINKFITACCRKFDMTVFKYKIDESMLVDEKHIDKKGLHILLGALKYVLFDIIPQVKVYERRDNNGSLQRKQKP